MKILESQNAILTNYEVFNHLQQQRIRYAKKELKGRRPGNLETVVKELLDYFNEAPNPLATKPIKYSETSINDLFEGLREFNLAKSELLLIMNLRPAGIVNLDTVLEEMSIRFTDEQLAGMVKIIGEILGKADAEAERTEMQNKAKQERNEDYNQAVQQPEVLEVDMEVDG